MQHGWPVWPFQEEDVVSVEWWRVRKWQPEEPEEPRPNSEEPAEIRAWIERLAAQACKDEPLHACLDQVPTRLGITFCDGSEAVVQLAPPGDVEISYPAAMPDGGQATSFFDAIKSISASCPDGRFRLRRIWELRRGLELPELDDQETAHGLRPAGEGGDHAPAVAGEPERALPGVSDESVEDLLMGSAERDARH